MFFTSSLLAIVFSLDSFGVGTAYGINGIKISLKSRIILFITSFLVVLFSIVFGKLILSLVPAWIANLFSSLFPAIIGILIIFQSIRKKPGISKILADPSISDFDSSLSIDSKEALFLGLAVSADAVATGLFYVNLYNSAFWFPALVAFFHLLFLSIGIIIGKKIKSISSLSPSIWSILSGIILISLSLFELLSN